MDLDLGSNLEEDLKLKTACTYSTLSRKINDPEHPKATTFAKYISNLEENSKKSKKRLLKVLESNISLSANIMEIYLEEKYIGWATYSPTPSFKNFLNSIQKKYETENKLLIIPQIKFLRLKYLYSLQIKNNPFGELYFEEKCLLLTNLKIGNTKFFIENGKLYLVWEFLPNQLRILAKIIDYKEKKTIGVIQLDEYFKKDFRVANGDPWIYYNNYTSKTGTINRIHSISQKTEIVLEKTPSSPILVAELLSKYILLIYPSNGFNIIRAKHKKVSGFLINDKNCKICDVQVDIKRNKIIFITRKNPPYLTETPTILTCYQAIISEAFKPKIESEILFDSVACPGIIKQNNNYTVPKKIISINEDFILFEEGVIFDLKKRKLLEMDESIFGFKLENNWYSINKNYEIKKDVENSADLDQGKKVLILRFGNKKTRN